MQELIISNPKSRKRRKMSALQRKYFGKRRTKRVRVTRVKRNPSVVRQQLATRKRHTQRPRRHSVRRAARSFTRSVRSIGRGLGGFESLMTEKLLPAAIGAGGALAVDLAWGYFPLPASLQTGPLAPVARIGGAIGIGVAASMVAGRKIGNEVLLGALTGTMYDLIKGYLKTNYTSLPLSAYLPPQGQLGVYLNEYTPDYVNEATQEFYEYAD